MQGDLESGEPCVINLMSFDVGRWNLVKATLGSLGLVRIILRTHKVETTESPAHNTIIRSMICTVSLFVTEQKKVKTKGKPCHAKTMKS